MFEESVIVSWMVYMACYRNVDHSVCSDDVADLASRFFALFIACRWRTLWKKMKRVFFKIMISLGSLRQLTH